jgi:carbamoyl-phosphate synthase large subunit
MGKASFAAKDIPVLADTDEVVNQTISIGGKEYPVTCVSVGNPHCVVFCDAIDGIDLSIIGPQFEYADIFPERVNTEFARVINKTTLRLRVWERGSGETLACGTGACAAVAVAVRLGLLPAGKSIDVKLPGGILSAIYTENSMHLTGDTLLTFEGCFVY